jgi:hypothetical protein
MAASSASKKYCICGERYFDYCKDKSCISREDLEEMISLFGKDNTRKLLLAQRYLEQSDYYSERAGTLIRSAFEKNHFSLDGGMILDYYKKLSEDIHVSMSEEEKKALILESVDIVLD